MPLFGDRRPNVRIDGLVAEAEFCLGSVRFDECEFRNAVRDDLDLFVGNLIDRAQQFPAFLGHHHDLGRYSMMRARTSR